MLETAPLVAKIVNATDASDRPLRLTVMLLLPIGHQATPGSPVLTAGDPERAHLEEIKEMGGIPYHLNVVNFMVRATTLQRTTTNLLWFIPSVSISTFQKT